jgi:hypothetical protein
MTSASERGASQRARYRWSRANVSSAEVAGVGTDAPAADVRAREDHKPSSARKPRSRSGVRDFVRSNPRLIGAIALAIVGIVLVILGWYGAAYTNILTEQIPYLISGGLLGVALIIVAGFLASSASLERENRELRRDLIRAIGAAGTAPRSGSHNSGHDPRDEQVFLVSGGRSYHFPGCPIIEGKETSALALQEAHGSGYGSCMLCGLD